MKTEVMKTDLFVIIPAYCEAKNISKVIRTTKRFAKNIIVVDDGSTDGTYKKALGESVTVLKHIVNMGKGATLKTGVEYAIRKGAKIIIALDGDGQHDPSEIPKFLKAIKNSDIVFGSRTMDKTMPGLLKFGNKVINAVNSLLFGIKLRDTQSGFRAFRTSAYKKIKWDSQDYSVESEMVANAGRRNLKYTEITIRTIYADNYKGTTIIDGIKIVLNMIWWRIRWR